MDPREPLIDSTKRLRMVAIVIAWSGFAIPIGAFMLANLNFFGGTLSSYLFIGAVFLGVASLMLFTVARDEKEDPNRRVATVSQWIGKIALVAFSVALGLLTLIALAATLPDSIGSVGSFLIYLFFSVISPFLYFVILNAIEKRISAQWARWLLYLIGLVSIAASGYFYR